VTMGIVPFESLQKGYRPTVVVGRAMIGSLFVFALIAEVLTHRQVPFTGFSHLPDRQYGILRYILAGVALFDFLLIPYLRRAAIKSITAGSSAADVTGSLAVKLATVSITSFGMCESIGIYGFVLFLLNGNRADLYPFLLASLLSFVIFFPRLEKWREWSDSAVCAVPVFGTPESAPAGTRRPTSQSTKAGAAFITLFCSVFILGGGAAAVQTSKRLIRNYALVNSGARTSGQVIDYKQTSGKRGTGRIWPVVEYEAPNGAKIRFESLYHPNYSGYSMGQTVPVVYDPKDPKVAEIDEPERLWGGILVPYLLAAVFSVFGSVMIFFTLRRRPQDDVHIKGPEDGAGAHIFPGTAPVKAPTTWEPPAIFTPQEMPATAGAAMTCPKCGYAQISRETCQSCGLIIAKFRPRPMVGATESSGKGISTIIWLLLVVLAVGGCYAGWQAFAGGKAGDFDASTGTYLNTRYRLSLTVPSGWKRYSVKEAISCASLRGEYADQYLFLASPTVPAECLLVVNISGLSLDYFRSVGWTGIVGETATRHPIRRSQVDTVGGFQVHRMGYQLAGFYREDAIFETGSTLIEIYFYVPDGADAASRADEIRAFIDASLRKL